MKKTSIYLEPELDAALARRAAEEGLTKAEFIRRGLAGLVTRPKRPRMSVGVAEGEPGPVANSVDRWLAESGFGED